ncbi:MAG: hypothetical protein JWR61_1145 [Ferruginibacter sp.]|nr:hypothetical protein [Ferruginibacter sp.]
MYWLDLLFSAQTLSEIEHHSAINDAEEIAKLLTSSIKTKRSNKK